MPAKKLLGMGVLNRVAKLLAFAERSDSSESAGITPPSRSAEHALTPDTAIRISTVYRAVEVLSIGVSQLGIDQWRGDKRVPAAAIITNPDTAPETSRPAFLEHTVVSLALNGNAYWRVLRGPDGITPIALRPLNPREVTPYFNERDERRYQWRGTDGLRPADRRAGDIMHLQKLRMPGRAAGLGPIEAARAELLGALQARDYSASWFERGDVPSGILTTDQPIGAAQAKTMKKIWAGINPETDEAEPVGYGVRVLGHGLKYDPLQIKPADLQFLETQEFNTTQIARLFGTPASLMLAVVQGNSQSYSNVEQDWIAFTRFTLMSYIREIEEAFTALLPYGNRVRFNVDALQRSDTKTRYEAHEIGLRAKFLKIDEVRRIEGLDPLTAGELAALESAATPAPKEIAQ